MGEKEEVKLKVDPRFNIFDKTQQDESIVANNFVEFHPISQISPTTSVIEFFIGGHDEQYIDTTGIYLKVSGSVTNESLTNADVKDSVCNNLLHALFSQIDVQYNDRLMTQSTNTYPIISYIKNLVTTTKTEKQSKLQSELFFMESSSEIDEVDLTKNRALLKRHGYVKSGNNLEMAGQLLVDVFSCSKFLINGVNIRVKLYKNRSQFYIMSALGDKSKATFVINKAVLVVPKMTINPQLYLSHAEMLKQGPAIYNFYQWRTRVHTIPQRNRSIQLESLFSDKIPSLCIVILLSSKSYSGAFNTNPFHLKHYKMHSGALILNGVNIPGNTMVGDFDSNVHTNASLYKTFTDAVEKHFNIRDCGIDIELFNKGYTMFFFDLSDSLLVSNNIKTRSGELRLRIDFTEELPEPVDLIALGRFPASMKINVSRVISHDMF